MEKSRKKKKEKTRIKAIDLYLNFLIILVVDNPGTKGTILTTPPQDFISLWPTTPLKLIKAIKPDVLVKGGDYKIKDVVGHKEIKSWGGVVKIIPLVPGLSTSKIIKKLR